MSRVKIDGSVEVPRHEWYQWIDIFTRIDNQLEVLIKQLDYTNRQLEQVVYILRVMARMPVTIPPPPPPPTPVPTPGPPIEIPGKVIALPFRVKPIGTAKYVVTENVASELLLTGDAFIIGVDANVYIGDRRDVQNFLLLGGSYLIMYRPAELNKLYAKSVTGTANIYIMYLEIVG